MKPSEYVKTLQIDQSMFPTKEQKEKLSMLDSSWYSGLKMNSDWVDMYLVCSYTPEAARPHSHPFWEIIFCAKGEIPYLIGTEKYHVRSGDVIVVPPGISHSLLPWDPEKGIYQRYVLWCSQPLMDWITGQMKEDRLFTGPGCVLRPTRIQQGYQLRMMKQGIQESKLKQSGWEIAQIGTTLQLTAYLSRIAQGQLAAPQTERSDLLLQIISYVQDHLSADLAVSTTARHFSISDSTLSHLFQKEMNIGFYRYVLQQRLTESKHLIFQGLPLETIAQQMGFSTYSAYYRAFKKEYGISPQSLPTDAILASSADAFKINFDAVTIPSLLRRLYISTL